MKKFLIPAFLAVLAAFGATHAADIPWPSEYIHVTNSATAQGVDDVPPSAYAHITNWASALIGFMTTDASNAQLPAARFNIGVPVFNPVTDHQAPTNGTTDAATQINASFADCTAAGGGRIILPNYRYVVTSADLTVPQGCTFGFSNWVGNERAASPLNLTTTPAILLSSAHTINVANGGAIDGLAIFQNGLSSPTNIRTAIQGVQSFAGTAITITGGSTKVRNAYVVGFQYCYFSNNNQRPSVESFYGDCTNGVHINGANDVGASRDVEFWPFYAANSAFQTFTASVSAASASTGVITVGIPTAGDQIIVGDQISVTGVGGYTGANNRWWVTSITPGGGTDTLALCQVPLVTGACPTASQSGPTPTGTWSASALNAQIVVSSLASLAVGQNVSGTNIGASSTISFIDYNQSMIYLSQPVTGAGAGTTLTVTNNAYTSGGTVTLSAIQRSGVAFYIADSQGMEFAQVFEYGWDTGYQVDGFASGRQSFWTKFVDASCDNNGTADPLTVCMKLSGHSFPVMGVNWIGGLVSGYGAGLFSDGGNPKAGAAANTVVGVHFGSNANTLVPISQASGTVILVGNDINTGTLSGISASDSISELNLSGNSFSGAKLLFGTTTGQTATTVDAATLLSSTSSRGGPVLMGTSLSVGGALANPTTDAVSARGNVNANISYSVYNPNAGASANATLFFGNGTSTSEAAIILRGSGFSGGNGPNAFEVNGIGGLYLRGGSNNGIKIDTSGHVIPVLPTSASGLPSGALWNNLGIVNVAP